MTLEPRLTSLPTHAPLPPLSSPIVPSLSLSLILSRPYPSVEMDSPVDVLTIGGGPAGLTAALTLVRQNYSAVLFNSGIYRNRDAEHMHMVPGWDHRDPSKFRTKGRSEILEHYEAVKIVKTHLTTAHKINNSLFEVADNSGKAWLGRKIILATGSQDISPDIPGYAEAWVKRM